MNIHANLIPFCLGEGPGWKFQLNTVVFLVFVLTGFTLDTLLGVIPHTTENGQVIYHSHDG